MLPQKIAFVDIETTGTSINHDRIIEIGVIRVENNKVVDKLQSLINPETYVPKEIEALTGITSRELSNAPVFSSVKKDLTKILADCVFSAHNSQFDYGFIKQEFAREELSFRAKNLCTVKLSRALFPGYKKHNLDEIINRFGIKCSVRHRAYDDALVLWEFYQKLFKLFSSEAVEAAIGKVMKRPNWPINLSETLLDNLPESPGVYIFYNSDGLPLYVGKSKNIHDRVLTHFSNPREQKLTQLVYSVETLQTPGEIGALFKESQLVKKLQPLYNRQLRRTEKFILATLVKARYYRVELQETDHIDPASLDNILGVFKSRSQAKNNLLAVCKEHRLCEKLLGLQMGIGECFGYQLGKCRGACVGLENPALYNARLLTAFIKHRIKKWPYDGPVAIKEGEEHHILNNWCYLGTKKFADDEINSRVNFDMDIYKILNRFLCKKRVNVINDAIFQSYVSGFDTTTQPF